MQESVALGRPVLVYEQLLARIEWLRRLYAQGHITGWATPADVSANLALMT